MKITENRKRRNSFVQINEKIRDAKIIEATEKRMAKTDVCNHCGKKLPDGYNPKLNGVPFCNSCIEEFREDMFLIAWPKMMGEIIVRKWKKYGYLRNGEIFEPPENIGKPEYELK